MKIHKKILLVSATVFLLAAGCNPGNRQQATGSSNQSTQAQLNTQTQTKQNIGGADSLSNAQKPAGLTVTQTVEGSNLNQPETRFVQGQSAMAVLEATHKTETKEYSGLGKMVLAIDGIKPDARHFWEFFVNGKSSSVGASSYILKTGDKIEWKLSAIK